MNLSPTFTPCVGTIPYSSRHKQNLPGTRTRAVASGDIIKMLTWTSLVLCSTWSIVWNIVWTIPCSSRHKHNLLGTRTPAVASGSIRVRLSHTVASGIYLVLYPFVQN